MHFIFSLFTSSFFASEQIRKKRKDIPPFEIFTGKKVYLRSFYNQLNTFENISINTPISFIGLGFTGTFYVLGKHSRSYHGHIALLYIVPESIKTENKEIGKITGYTFTLSVFGWNLLKKESPMELYLSGGFNIGRIRIIQNELMKQKNPIVAPMIAFCPKIKLGRFTLGMNTLFDFDITNSKWKKTVFANSNKLPLQQFRQTGLTALFCLGYIWQ